MPESAHDDQQALDLLTTLLARAKRAGADAADALYVESASPSRLDKTEHRYMMMQPIFIQRMPRKMPKSGNYWEHQP